MIRASFDLQIWRLWPTIYDKKSGALYYDADGTGKIPQAQFAKIMLDGKPVLNLTYADF